MLSDKYYTLGQTAIELDVTRQTISRWLQKGTIVGENFGRMVIFEKSLIKDLKSKRYGIKSRRFNCINKMSLDELKLLKDKIEKRMTEITRDN